ncbi:MAG: acetyl-CoA carboxylase biotin carboxyl carrier protein [Thermoanaerobaculia bacterium]|nr:acetyl-CoA carboxylase biotin carboxyl carrier protein [Thermoanaerobaculia bacterium]
MTFEQIKELVELVDERELAGLEIERSGFRLKIEGRAPEPVVTQVAAPSPVSEQPRSASAPDAPAHEAVSPSTRAEEQAPTEEESEVPEGAHVVSSPIVGTFYSSPSPDSDPYVKVGDRVEKGQVLCIVEAMKLMNEIESDVDGEVLEIYPKNAQAVEFGEPLFAIETG